MKIINNRIILTTKEIAAELNVAQKYISELVQDQGMPKLKHNQFDLVDVLRWHREYKLAEKDRIIKKLQDDDPQKDLARKNAEKRELELQEMRGEIVFVDQLKPAWLSQIKIIVQKLDGFPAKTAPLLKGLGTIPEIKKVLTNNINKVKEDISQAEVIF